MVMLIDICIKYPEGPARITGTGIALPGYLVLLYRLLIHQLIPRQLAYSFSHLRNLFSIRIPHIWEVLMGFSLANVPWENMNPESEVGFCPDF